MNVIVRPEFELVYYDVAIQHVSHNTTGTFPSTKSNINIRLEKTRTVIDHMKIWSLRENKTGILPSYSHVSTTGCLKIYATHKYDNAICIKSSFIWVLKKQSYHFRKVKPDDKGRNWLTLSYCAGERTNSWGPLRRDFIGLLPTESLTASILSGYLVAIFLSDLGFSTFLLRYFTDPVVWNLRTQRQIWLF